MQQTLRKLIFAAVLILCILTGYRLKKPDLVTGDPFFWKNLEYKECFAKQTVPP
jgi:hypothetical protein